MRLLLTSLVLIALTAGAAAAREVSLRDTVVDSDGQVTLGDLFEGAGQAGELVIATHQTPSVVLDAGAVQMAASRAGLIWANPRGLRRIIVRPGEGGARSERYAERPAVGGGQAAPDVAREVIRVGDLVTVRWADGGLSLTLDAKAMTSAAPGQAVTLMNPASKKSFEAVAVGPGHALAGPAAQTARLAALSSSPLQR